MLWNINASRLHDVFCLRTRHNDSCVLIRPTKGVEGGGREVGGGGGRVTATELGKGRFRNSTLPVWERFPV